MTLRQHLAAVLVSTALLTGCSTVMTKHGGRWGEEYSGTRCAGMTTGLVFLYMPPLAPLTFPDLILSVAADTVLLPADLFIKNPDPKGGCNEFKPFGRLPDQEAEETKRSVARLESQ